jgi:hypothetical protein
MAESKTDYSEPYYVQQQDKDKVPFWRATIAENTPLEVSCRPLTVAVRNNVH